MGSGRGIFLKNNVGGCPYPVAMLADLWAEALGVHIVYRPIPGETCGLYDYRTKTVYVDSTMSPIPSNSTLMHELGHAFFGHSGCLPKWEREASGWASRQLIDPDAFRDAANLFEGSVAIANELGVLPRDVENYVSIVLKSSADIVSRYVSTTSA